MSSAYSSNILEDDIRRRADQGLSDLGTQINDLSLISEQIRDQLKSETGLYSDVESAFDKNKTLLSKETKPNV